MRFQSPNLHPQQCVSNPHTWIPKLTTPAVRSQSPHLDPQTYIPAVRFPSPHLDPQSYIPNPHTYSSAFPIPKLGSPHLHPQQCVSHPPTYIPSTVCFQSPNFIPTGAIPKRAAWTNSGSHLVHLIHSIRFGRLDFHPIEASLCWQVVHIFCAADRELAHTHVPQWR